MSKVKQFKDLEQVSEQGLPIEIQGEEYTLKPLALEDHAKAKRKIRAEGLKSYEEYLDMVEADPDMSLPPRTEITKQRTSILQDSISDAEMNDFFTTLQGLQYLVYLSLKKEHPDITLEKIESWLTDYETLDQIATYIEAISNFTSNDEDEDEGSAEGNEDGEGEEDSSRNGSPTSHE